MRAAADELQAAQLCSLQGFILKNKKENPPYLSSVVYLCVY